MTEMTATFNRVIFYCLGNILLWRVCFSFTTLSAYANYKPTSAWLNWRLNSQKVDFLHYVEYPNDDYSHILGINDELHTPSKLQEISASTLKDVALNKQQVDVVGYLSSI